MVISPAPRLGWISLPWLCLGCVVFSFLAAPFTKENFDVIDCWLTWSRHSNGWRPWEIYAARADCNYPPFVLYVLTFTQLMINALHADQYGPLAILLVKLPDIVACFLGGVACYFGMAAWFGRAEARLSTIAYLLCLPVWFNAAVWGQWDALLSLAMVVALLLMINQRPLMCGAAIGWALSIKLLAIVMLPAMAIYAVRNWSVPKLAISAISALAMWCLIALPFFIAGQGQGVIRSYTGAVNYYPQLSLGAFNGWQLVNLYKLDYQHLAINVADSDAAPFIGIINARWVGLILLTAYVGWLCVALFRRPTQVNMLATAGWTGVAFFMLPTQVHQRYLVPASAMLTLVACSGFFKSWLATSVAALINQAIVLLYEQRADTGRFTATDPQLFRRLYCVMSIINVAGFIWLTCVHARRIREVLPEPSKIAAGSG